MFAVSEAKTNGIVILPDPLQHWSRLVAGLVFHFRIGIWQGSKVPEGLGWSLLPTPNIDKKRNQLQAWQLPGCPTLARQETEFGIPALL